MTEFQRWFEEKKNLFLNFRDHLNTHEKERICFLASQEKKGWRHPLFQIGFVCRVRKISHFSLVYIYFLVDGRWRYDEGLYDTAFWWKKWVKESEWKKTTWGKTSGWSCICWLIDSVEMNGFFWTKVKTWGKGIYFVIILMRYMWGDWYLIDNRIIHMIIYTEEMCSEGARVVSERDEEIEKGKKGEDGGEFEWGFLFLGCHEKGKGRGSSQKYEEDWEKGLHEK